MLSCFFCLFLSFVCFCSHVSRYLYTDPLHCNMTYLFLRLLKDDLKEYTYAARLAGLVYGVASGMNAILVSTEGQRSGWGGGGGGGGGALPALSPRAVGPGPLRVQGSEVL